MKRKIPVYSGLKGTGKTSYVRAFADSKNFEFYRLNCIHADAELFNEALFSAQSQIVKGKIKGAVFLLSNIYKADKEWKKSFVRYSNNYFVINFKGSLKMIEISDSIFVVGENTVQPLQSIKDKIS
jgi:replication-associated recombination protein RarA